MNRVLAKSAALVKAAARLQEKRAFAEIKSSRLLIEQSAAFLVLTKSVKSGKGEFFEIWQKVCGRIRHR